MTPSTKEMLPLRLHLGKVRLTAPAVGELGNGARERSQPGDVEWLVAEALALVEGLRPLIEAVKVRLRAGVPDVYTLGDAVRAVFSETLALADTAASRASDEEASRPPVVGLAELRRATAEARDWTARIVENWPGQDRPFGPFDRDRIDRSYQAIARGEGEDAGDILARLKAGGPLVQGD